MPGGSPQCEELYWKVEALGRLIITDPNNQRWEKQKQCFMVLETEAIGAALTLVRSNISPAPSSEWRLHDSTLTIPFNSNDICHLEVALTAWQSHCLLDSSLVLCMWTGMPWDTDSIRNLRTTGPVQTPESLFRWQQARTRKACFRLWQGREPCLCHVKPLSTWFEA